MNRQSITFGIGSAALIDKFNAQTGFFKTVFGGLGGRAREFIPSVKLLMANKLEGSASISRIKDFFPWEKMKVIGFRKEVSDRTLNRTLERIGGSGQFVIENYQI